MITKIQFLNILGHYLFEHLKEVGIIEKATSDWNIVMENVWKKEELKFKNMKLKIFKFFMYNN